MSDKRRKSPRHTHPVGKRGKKPGQKGNEGRKRPIPSLVGEMSPKATEGGAVPPRRAERSSSTGKRPTSPRSALPGISPTRGEIGQSGERIAKRLSRAGIASRREAETIIAAGRVKVNGEVLSSPAFVVKPTDRIEIDGKPIPVVERTRLFLFHKPAGVVTTTRDPEGRKTVFDVLPPGLPRLMTVGRLDINTEGLLLLTNDGGLARMLELPTTGWLRRYRVRVHGKPDEKALAELRNGIAVEGVFYGSIEAAVEREVGSNAWLAIGLREGKNREVKKILNALGLEVTRLIRVSFGPFQLGELAEGEVREIRGRTLRDQLGERLIEEAEANFDAPVVTPFSSRPAGEEAEHARGPGAGERATRPAAGTKHRKRDRDSSREEALGRLSTKRDEKSFRKGREDKPAGHRDKRDEPRRSRAANVWMAPGARPVGKKAETETPAPRLRGEGRGEGQRPKGKKGPRPSFTTPDHEDRSRPSSAARASSPRKWGEGKAATPATSRGEGKGEGQHPKWKKKAQPSTKARSQEFGGPSSSKRGKGGSAKPRKGKLDADRRR
jgi:23S rRNA pseudouridine2605 synthase